MKKQKTPEKLFKEFIETIAMLRHPKHGCPWDLKQTHKSLIPYMLEEAYEASHALAQKNQENIKEELGDVLLQVVLNSQIAKDNKEFSIDDVIASINAKMIKRHPHVFQKDKEKHLKKIKKNYESYWRSLKDEEKKLSTTSSASFFSKEEKINYLPGLKVAVKIGKRSKQIGFDWDNEKQVFLKLKEEVEELESALKSKNKNNIEDEISDLLFTTAQLCRHLNLDPEFLATKGNSKFIKRFKILEQIAASEKNDLRKMTKKDLENLWQKAKNRQKKY